MTESRESNSELSTRRLVEVAADCFEQEEGSTTVTDTKLFDQVMPTLCERIEDDVAQFNISKDSLRLELRDFLSQVKDESNPGQYFQDNFEKFEDQIRAKPTTRYTVAFPLNFSFKPGNKRDKFSALGHEIERVPRRKWLEEFKEPAEEAEQNRDQGNREDPFTSFMDEVPNEFKRNHTYWKFEIEARDGQYAVNRLGKVLEYLLGKINVAAHAGKKEGHSYDNSAWPSGWSDLKLPFIYFVYEDGDYSQFFYNTDISPRKKFSVHSSQRSIFDDLLAKFPDIDQSSTELERNFVETIRRFQSAISEPVRDDSFLEYWRGVESLTLTDEEDNMSTVVRRAAAQLEHEYPDIFEFRLRRARKKRNQLVHEGVDVSVNKDDQNLLKSVLEQLIWLYCEQIDSWNKSDFEFYLDNVDIDTGQLENKKDRFSDQMKIIDEIIEAKQYEPSGLQKILSDWAKQENELEDADFLDPWGFFFPMFGVGDSNAEIMIISRSPVYPIGEDKEPIRARSQIQGWQPNLTHWTLEDIREHNSEIIEQGNPDNTWEIIQAVADAAGLEPEEVYYTTLQKDGMFDETEEEIEDEFDPSDLNTESIEQWKPYLEEEIDVVDPDLIVVFGETTLEAVMDILSVIEDESSEDVPQEEVYVLDRYPVIWFDHWQEIELPDGTKAEKTLYEVIENSDW